MRKYIHILIAAFMLLPLGFAYSEEVITWEECVRQAMDNNPDLVSAIEKVRQAKSDKDIAISGILPQVESQASGKRSKSAGRKIGNSYSYSMTGEQLVFDGFKISSKPISTACNFEFNLAPKLNLKLTPKGSILYAKFI